LSLKTIEMSNPYKVLNIDQNASKQEIMKAQMIAMAEKKHPLQVIQVAAKQLLNPAKRLAADFMFPSKIKAKRPQRLSFDISVEEVDLNEIDQNELDSIK